MNELLAAASYSSNSAEGEPGPDLPNLRRQALWESIFLLHKAAHIVRAAESHAVQGKTSWSQFGAYHGAFLAAKALMGFFGVCLAQPAGQQLMLDFLPVREKRQGKAKVTNLGVNSDAFTYIRLGQLDHLNVWELFQRVVRVTDAPFLDKRIKELLTKQLNWEDISPKRNPFIYSCVFWPYSDLHADAPVQDFCKEPRRDEDGSPVLEIDSASFLLEFGYITLSVAAQVFTVLCDEAPVLGTELMLLKSNFDSPNSATFSAYRTAWQSP